MTTKWYYTMPPQGVGVGGGWQPVQNPRFILGWESCRPEVRQRHDCVFSSSSALRGGIEDDRLVHAEGQ